MSWSVQKIGTKDKVKAACEEELLRCAKGYERQEEEKDVLMAKDRILSAIDDMGVKGDAYSHGVDYGVSVTASGSRSSYSVTISLQVQRVVLYV